MRMRQKGPARPARIAAAVAMSVVACAAAARGQTAGDAAAVLKAAIDVHIHTAPDDRPRSLDPFEAARTARDRGMRAIVLKNHYESTAAQAFLVRAIVREWRSSAASTSTSPWVESIRPPSST